MPEPWDRQLHSRLFYFGEYASHHYGSMVLNVDGTVKASFNYHRETLYRVKGETLSFYAPDGATCTSRLTLIQERPMLFHGSSIGLNNRLYLMEALLLPQPEHPMENSGVLPVALVNTAPKSGTYFLHKVLMTLGFAATDLHLFSNELVDNRALPRDVSIHRSWWLRSVPLSLSLLGPLLPAGSVSVGHIDSLELLEQYQQQGIFLIPVVRDLRAILWSLFYFKLAVVEPRDEHDRLWRRQATPLAQLLGFFACYLERDLVHIANCFRTFSRLRGVPVFRYEELSRGHLSQEAVGYLDTHLRPCGGAAAFRSALARSYRSPTSTLSDSLPNRPRFSRGDRAELRRSIDALVAGSALAEVNALFGYL
ncbi:MAG: hypothetical protein ACK55X_01475 [Synechococcaceae cyanobacterium]